MITLVAPALHHNSHQQEDCKIHGTKAFLSDLVLVVHPCKLIHFCCFSLLLWGLFFSVVAIQDMVADLAVQTAAVAAVVVFKLQQCLGMIGIGGIYSQCRPAAYNGIFFRIHFQQQIKGSFLTGRFVLLYPINKEKRHHGVDDQIVKGIRTQAFDFLGACFMESVMGMPIGGRFDIQQVFHFPDLSFFQDI